jgi:hypothetical protein
MMMPRMKAQAYADKLRELKGEIMSLMAKHPSCAEEEPELAKALGVEGGEEEGESMAEESEEEETESPIKKMAREAMSESKAPPKRPGTASLIVAMGSPMSKDKGSKKKAY